MRAPCPPPADAFSRAFCHSCNVVDAAMASLERQKLLRLLTAMLPLLACLRLLLPFRPSLVKGKGMCFCYRGLCCSAICDTYLS